jgi:hypothetical protein
MSLMRPLLHQQSARLRLQVKERPSAVAHGLETTRNLASGHLCVKTTCSLNITRHPVRGYNSDNPLSRLSTLVPFSRPGVR